MKAQNSSARNNTYIMYDAKAYVDDLEEDD